MKYVSEEKSFVIPAKGSSTIPLFISLNPKSIINNLIELSLGVGKNRDIKLTLSGYAKVESGFFKTTLPIKYETSVKEYLAYLKP